MPIISQLTNSTLCIPNIVAGTGPIFETGTDFTRSDIQALVRGGVLRRSQDLFRGRLTTSGNTSFFAPPSNPPVSLPDPAAGDPFYPAYGGSTTYNQSGPPDGRY